MRNRFYVWLLLTPRRSLLCTRYLRRTGRRRLEWKNSKRLFKEFPVKNAQDGDRTRRGS